MEGSGRYGDLVDVGLPQGNCHKLAGSAVGQEVEAAEAGLFPDTGQLFLGNPDGAVDSFRCGLG
jgi:hypothetical protein